MQTIPESEGRNKKIKVTKSITYYFKNRGQRFSETIAEATFVWEATTDYPTGHDDKWDWSGIFKIPALPILRNPITFPLKWNIYRSLIRFSDPIDFASVLRVPLNNEKDCVVGYLHRFLSAMEGSTTTFSGAYISWYTIEYDVRNQCREALHDFYTNHPIEALDIDHLSGNVWESIRTNGVILSPMKSRLHQFKKNMMEHVLEQPYRIKPVDDLLETVIELIKTVDLNSLLEIFREKILIRSCQHYFFKALLGVGG